MITKQHIATFPALAPAKVHTARARRRASASCRFAERRADGAAMGRSRRCTTRPWLPRPSSWTRCPPRLTLPTLRRARPRSRSSRSASSPRRPRCAAQRARACALHAARADAAGADSPTRTPCAPSSRRRRPTSRHPCRRCAGYRTRPARAPRPLIPHGRHAQICHIGVNVGASTPTGTITFHTIADTPVDEKDETVLRAAPPTPSVGPHVVGSSARAAVPGHAVRGRAAQAAGVPQEGRGAARRHRSVRLPARAR
jgi:hypothetical protein